MARLTLSPSKDQADAKDCAARLAFSGSWGCCEETLAMRGLATRTVARVLRGDILDSPER
jgi:hypothetical protein